MINVAKYHAGMSKALDEILECTSKAWVVRDDKYASEVVIAEDEEDAIRRYEALLKARQIPHRSRRKKVNK